MEAQRLKLCLLIYIEKERQVFGLDRTLDDKSLGIQALKLCSFLKFGSAKVNETQIDKERKKRWR